jgi:hypothetical protein
LENVSSGVTRSGQKAGMKCAQGVRNGQFDSLFQPARRNAANRASTPTAQSLCYKAVVEAA